MNKWFLRENSRRFYRIDVPVRVFMAPSSPIKDLEIYATGMDYFPPIINELIDKQLNSTLYWLHRVQEERDLLEPLFKEIITAIKFLGEGTEKMSRGLNPKNDKVFFFSINKKLAGFHHLDALSKSAPKTYTYLKLIEDKYLFFLNAFTDSIKHSSRSQFKAKFDFAMQFKIDKAIKDFNHPKFEHVPLVRAIVALTSYMNTYTNTFKEICRDNIIRSRPELWPKLIANLSASGIAISFPKTFNNFEKVDVLMFFPENRQILSLHGTVAHIQDNKAKYQKRVAVNFEFPDGKDQDFLIYKIQELELSLCEQLVL